MPVSGSATAHASVVALSGLPIDVPVTPSQARPAGLAAGRMMAGNRMRDNAPAVTWTIEYPVDSDRRPGSAGLFTGVVMHQTHQQRSITVSSAAGRLDLEPGIGP